MQQKVFLPGKQDLTKLVGLILYALSLLVLLTASGVTSATVQMQGTRIIYDGARPGTLLKFSNPDDFPSIIQIWVDSGTENAGPEKVAGPFLLSPPVFRIDPNNDQTVRMTYTGQGVIDLPLDRESLFYLNFSIHPALPGNSQDKNYVALVIRQRLKLFYRPAQVKATSSDIPSSLKATLVSGPGGKKQLQINNSSPLHANLAAVELVRAGKASPLSEEVMIPPVTSHTWSYEGKASADDKVKVTLITDYGNIVEIELPLG
ncbi:fimbrial biogenesis chaperone [Pseudomonas sp. PGPR81]|uniref:fimbrial biogenesis chaperone n=1 Tax=Pseudomonas sp. PGPR81 TaxID=2913477 RepID=UPI001EDC736C|nr:molecular chaperone [Pseudomonas sp. PGPR81]